MFLCEQVSVVVVVVVGKDECLCELELKYECISKLLHISFNIQDNANIHILLRMATFVWRQNKHKKLWKQFPLTGFCVFFLFIYIFFDKILLRNMIYEI